MAGQVAAVVQDARYFNSTCVNAAVKKIVPGMFHAGVPRAAPAQREMIGSGPSSPQLAPIEGTRPDRIGGKITDGLA